MNYYDSQSKQLLTETLVTNRGLSLRNSALLEIAGIWAVTEKSQDPEPGIGEPQKVYDSRFYAYNATEFVVDTALHTATQYFRHEEFTVPELREALKRLQVNKPGFTEAFLEIDYRRTRPASSISEALALGETPDRADTDILGQLNMVAEDNRLILMQLDALNIPVESSFGEACTILDVAYNHKPWLPWASGDV